jgi:hypothetical protein
MAYVHGYSGCTADQYILLEISDTLISTVRPDWAYA